MEPEPVWRTRWCLQRLRHDHRALWRHVPEYGRAGSGAGQWRGAAAGTARAIATKPQDYQHVQAFSDRLVRQALAWEGTASGEHGIGLVKRGFMAEEHGAAVTWMQRLKTLFDPDGLLNPGKLI